MFAAIVIEDATEKVGSRCDRWDREQSDLTRQETGPYDALKQGKSDQKPVP